MADVTQMEDALVQAHTAGDFEAAKVIADEIRKARTPSAPPITGGQRFMQGLRDPFNAAAQLVTRGAQFSPAMLPFTIADKIGNPNAVSVQMQNLQQSVDDSVVSQESAYNAGRQAAVPPTLSSLVTGQKDAPGFDWMRLAGNVVNPINLLPGAAIAKAPASMTAGQMFQQGAKMGLLTAPLTAPVTSAQGVSDPMSFAAEKGMQAGAGAVAGGLLSTGVGMAGRGILSAMERPQIAAQAASQVEDSIRRAVSEVGARFDDLPASLQAEIRNAADQALQAGKNLDVAALLRKRDFEAAGIKPLLGQITRDPTQFAAERNLRAADPRLATALNTQNSELARNILGFGGRDAMEAQAAGGQMVNALRSVDEQMRGQVSGAYRAARASSGAEMDVPMQTIAQDMADISKRYGGAFPSGIRNMLDDYGIFGGQQVRQFTMQDAENVMQQANRLKTNDPAVNSAISEVNAALKRAVSGADTAGGPFSEARNLASKRFQLQDAIPALKAAADGDASPDQFVGRFILNGETKDVRSLATFLRETSPDQYQEARNQIGRRLFQAAYGENPSGDKAFRPESFAAAIRSMGREKLGAFFSGAEIDQMQRLARVGAWMEQAPAGAPVNYSNSMTSILPYMMRLPGMTGLPAIAGMVQAGAREAQNAAVARAALNAQVPFGQVPLSDIAARRLGLLVGGAGIGGGIMAGAK